MSTKSKLWDQDIEKLYLSDEEKNGLQVYRNYTKAFANHKNKEFIKSVNKIKFDLSSLEKVLDAMHTEDQKLLPLIICAFAEDLLTEMFKDIIPEEIPGGRADMFGSYGPIGNLSNKIKLACAFGYLNKDILTDINALRKIRNDISHSWNIEKSINFFIKEPASNISQIETLIDDGIRLPKLFHDELNDLDKFKVRLIWIASRLVYECKLYPLARKAYIEPSEVLYQPPNADLLVKVSSLAVKATKELIK